MSDTQSSLVVAPQRLSRRFFPFSRSDKIAAVILAILAFALNERFGQLGGFAGLLLMLALLWPLGWDKTYGTFLTKLTDASITTIDQGILWENVSVLKQLGEYSQPSWLRRVLHVLVRRRDPYSLRIDSMQDGQYGQVGLGYNFRENTDSVVFLGNGSELSRKDPATQLSMLANLAGAVRRLSYGMNASVTFIARPRPADIREFDTAIANSHHPEVVVPAATLRQLQEFESSNELVDPEVLYEQGKITQDELRWHRLQNLAIVHPRSDYLHNALEADYAVVITVPRDARIRKAARRWKRQPLDTKVVRQLPIIRTLRVADVALRNLNVEGLRLLDREELEVFCADWKPFDEPIGGIETGMSRHHPQYGVYGSKHAIEEDGVISTTFKVTTTPSALDGNTIAELFTHTTPQVTLAVKGENTRGGKEGSSLYWLTSIFDAFTENMRLGKSIEKRRRDIEGVSDQIAESRDLQHMTILLRLTGLDPEEHAENSDMLLREAAGLGFLIEPAPGVSLQYQAMLAAKTGMVTI